MHIINAWRILWEGAVGILENFVLYKLYFIVVNIVGPCGFFCTFVAELVTPANFTWVDFLVSSGVLVIQNPASIVSSMVLVIQVLLSLRIGLVR